jgi:RNA polymerase sigma factor for flagellar operon FliA
MIVATQTYRQRAAPAQRDALILSHMSLVRHILGKIAVHFPAGVDVENLESAGVLGLVDAASRFDPSKGFQFKTYAYIRIRGAVLDELRRNCPLPQHVLEKVAKVRQAGAALPPDATVADLAAAAGMSQDEVTDCLTARQVMRMLSLDRSAEQVTAAERPDELAQVEERKRLLARGIAALPERERLVVTLHYLEDLRLKEIGRVLELSESRVSRLLTAALFKLRSYIGSRES